MTEEENKAIEYLKDYIKSDLNYFTIDFNNNLRIAINLIEKQKCELEINEANLKGYSRQVQKDDEKIEKLQKENEELRVQGSIILLDYNILKDKIKDKINDYKTRTKYIADVYNSIYLEIAKDFEELLEEE